MTLRDVDFPPKDDGLRQDVGALGDLVGAVLRDQGGDALFGCVETARRAAIRRREGDPEAGRDLERTLHGLEATRARDVVRGFSTYFQVVNLAERAHRIRRGRAWMREEGTAQPGSLADTVLRLRALGLDEEEMLARFAAVRVEPVFTAHPTESTRRAILDKQERITAELIARFDRERTPREEQVAWSRIRESVTAAWQTEEHPTERPTVADEREHVLYYVSRVLYRVLPALHEALEDALGTSVDGLPPLLRPGSWVGGDMDGNPNVDAGTLQATLVRHRALALETYRREIAELAGALTQSATRIEWSDDVARLIRRYEADFPDAARAIPGRHRAMGYRVLLTLIGARLEATRADRDGGYSGPGQLLSDLRTIEDSLRENRGEHAGLFGVHRMILRVRAFGFHLAALDVRQDARVLREAVAQLRGDAAWPTRTAEERARALAADLAAADFAAVRSALVEPDPVARRELDVFRALRESRERFGPDAIGYYIVSMAQDSDDLLTVLWLSAVAGDDPAASIPLDVAPLLETVPDLEGADAVLDRIFTDVVLRRHLAAREFRQLVMVGYSDSNKDGGIAAARWALHGALERMAHTAARHGITLTVFHGRGGTVSRGGGSVHKAVEAMPAASIGGRLRLTEQGEVIDAKYGLPQIAHREVERMLGAMVLREAGPSEHVPEEWREAADTLARHAREAYRSLVYDDARFLDLFRGATPIDVIERMAIGSRPASRRSGAGIEDLRAIPWVFAWTQCRAMTTGWYGMGTGLAAARAEHGEALLREATSRWPFLDALLSDVEMVLAKADLEIASRYVPLAPPETSPVFDRIREEFERTVSEILLLRGTDALLSADPTLQRSIRLRNPYVDPMNVVQVDLLARWREAGRPDGPLLDALLATVNGIARGLQNTG